MMKHFTRVILAFFLFESSLLVADHEKNIEPTNNTIEGNEQSEKVWIEGQTPTCRDQTVKTLDPLIFAEELQCELVRKYIVTYSDGKSAVVTKPIERAFIGLYLTLLEKPATASHTQGILAKLHYNLWNNSSKKFSQIDGTLIEESDPEVSKLLIELYRLAGLSPLPKEIGSEAIHQLRIAWPHLFQKRLMLPSERRELATQIVQDATKLAKSTADSHRLWESLKPLPQFSERGIPDLTGSVQEPIDKAEFEKRKYIYNETMKKAGLAFKPEEGFSLLPGRTHLDLSTLSPAELDAIGLRNFKFSPLPLLPLSDGRFLIGMDLTDEDTYRTPTFGKFYPASKEELGNLPQAIKAFLTHKGYAFDSEGRVSFNSLSNQETALGELREPFSEDRRLLEMYQPGLADVLLGYGMKAQVLTGIKNNFNISIPSYPGIVPVSTSDEAHHEQSKLYELSLKNYQETKSYNAPSKYETEKVENALTVIEMSFDLANRGITPVSAPIVFRNAFRELASLSRQLSKAEPKSELYFQLMEAKALLLTYLKDSIYVRYDGYIANASDRGWSRAREDKDRWVNYRPVKTLREDTVTEYNRAYHSVNSPRDYNNPSTLSPIEVMDSCHDYQSRFLEGVEDVQSTNAELYTRGNALGMGNTMANRLWDPVLGQYTESRNAHNKAIEYQQSLLQEVFELSKKDERFQTCSRELSFWFQRMVQADAEQAKATLNALKSDYLKRFTGAVAVVATAGIGSAVVGASTGVAEVTGGYIATGAIVGAATGAASYGVQFAATKYIDGDSKAKFSGKALTESMLMGGVMGAAAPVFPNLSTAVGLGMSYVGGENAGAAAAEGKYGLIASEILNRTVLPFATPAVRKMSALYFGQKQSTPLYTAEVVGPRTAGTPEAPLIPEVIGPATSGTQVVPLRGAAPKNATTPKQVPPPVRKIPSQARHPFTEEPTVGPGRVHYYTGRQGNAADLVSPRINEILIRPETHQIPEYSIAESRLFHQNIPNQKRVELLNSVPLGDVMSAPGHAILRSPESVRAISSEMAKPGWSAPQSWHEQPMILNVVTEALSNGQVKVRAVELQDGNHRFAAGLDSGRWKTLGDIPKELLLVKVNGQLPEGGGLPVRWIPLDVAKQSKGISWTDVSSNPQAKGPTAQINGDVSSIDSRFAISDRGVRIEEVLRISLMRLAGAKATPEP